MLYILGLIHDTLYLVHPPTAYSLQLAMLLPHHVHQPAVAARQSLNGHSCLACTCALVILHPAPAAQQPAQQPACLCAGSVDFFFFFFTDCTRAAALRLCGCIKRV